MPRNLLRDAVFTQLLAHILHGEYRRGQRLRLDEIAEDMRVSRTPVREALVPLETLRLVTVQRYVGVVIAHWSIEHVVERLRITRIMLRDLGRLAGARAEPFDRALVADCASTAGVMVLLAEWVFRARDRPVCADWVAAQFPLLDQLFTADIAELHGVDVAPGHRERAKAVERALLRAGDGDVDGVRTDVVELLDGFSALPKRFRAGAASAAGAS